MPLPKISDRFNGALQKTAQEQKIVELQAEISRLRASQSPHLEDQVQALREQLEKSGEKLIRLDLIDPNHGQPRQSITHFLIQAKARSLDTYGQITPLVLIEREEDRYVLLDGQLRWEAAKFLGWETIRAVIVPMPKDLDRNSLLTFLHFEDLNPLDKAEAIVREVVKATQLETNEVLTTLATVLKRIERDGKTKQLTSLVAATVEEQKQGLEVLGVREKEQSLLLILLELGLNPGSVKANLLPMLSLPNDLKVAIRQQGLKGAHALAISALSAKALSISEEKAAEERTLVTRKVLEKDLSVPETRRLVAEIKAKSESTFNFKPIEIPLADRMLVVTKQLKRVKVLSDPKKQKKLERLLAEMEILIQED